MAFDNLYQYTIDANGNPQFIDPLYFLYSQEYNENLIPSFIGKYLNEQTELKNVINSKYLPLKNSTPKGVVDAPMGDEKGGYSLGIKGHRSKVKESHYKPQIPEVNRSDVFRQNPRRPQPTLKSFKFGF